MLTSTRRGIVYPAPTRGDSADVPRDIGALVTALELDVIYGQGTLAARPVSTAGSPGIQGRVYMATDQTPHAFFYDYGTGWDSVGALAAGSVGTTQLADGSVTGGPAGAGVKIAALTVSRDNIVHGTIRGSQAGAGNNNEIASGTVAFVDMHSSLSPAGGAGAATEAFRALGTAAGTAAAGTHASQHSRTGADPLVISTFIGSGTAAARPSTGLVAGMLYTSTDVGGGREEEYNGTAWIPTGHAVNIAAGEVTSAMLAAGAAAGNLGAGSVTSAMLAAGAAAGNLSAGSITSAMILDGTIADADISGTAAIALAKLADTIMAAVAAGHHAESGTVSGTEAGGGFTAAVTFARTFASAPRVLIQHINDTTNWFPTSITTTGFTANGSGTIGAHTAHWFAEGA